MPMSTTSSAASLKTHASIAPMDSFEEQLLEDDDEFDDGIDDESESPSNRVALHLEGQLEKKSPAQHSRWQPRWFKVMTRVGDSATGAFA